MKTVIFDPPEHDFFIYVAPWGSKMKYGKMINEKPVTQFNINGKIIKAEFVDVMRYPFNRTFDFVSQWAYGMTTEELRQYLKYKWPKLGPGSEIGFYLFRKINK